MVMVTLLALGACEKPDNDKTHDELIAEMGERGRAYHEKRQAFLNSELYEAAFAYVQDTLDEFYRVARQIFSLNREALSVMI